MDYKQKWNRLKEWLEEAVEEGINRGFDKEQCSAEGGMFYTYKIVLEEMKLREGGLND